METVGDTMITWRIVYFFGIVLSFVQFLLLFFALQNIYYGGQEISEAARELKNKKLESAGGLIKGSAKNIFYLFAIDALVVLFFLGLSYVL